MPGVGDEQRVEAYLSSLSRDELIERLTTMARGDRASWRALRSEAAAARGDAAAVRRGITQATTIRGYLTYHDAPQFEDAVDGALDGVEHLLDVGLAADAVTCSEHAVKRLEACLGKVDDSDGCLGRLVDRIGALHLAGCQRLRPPPRALAARLLRVGETTELDWFEDLAERYCDVLGDDGLDECESILRARIARHPHIGPRRSGAVDEDPDLFRAQRQLRSLARARGDVDLEVEALSHDLGHPYDFVQIAEVLSAAGRRNDALAWARRGLAAFGADADDRLVDSAVRLLVADGDEEEALSVVFDALERRPTAGAYRRLKGLAHRRGDWSRLRRRALAALTPPDDGDASALVEALLGDDDVPAAWKARTNRRLRCDILWQLAVARAETHPDDGLRVFRARLSEALERASDHSYDEAVRSMRQIRETLEAHGRVGEAAAEARDVCEAFRRRPKLVRLITDAGLLDG